uniref:Uncharacterized protein n=1 Tax=Melopsittacus undulatus TaxID=13146 RepID=A0A8C6J3X4_MELUD
ASFLFPKLSVPTNSSCADCTETEDGGLNMSTPTPRPSFCLTVPVMYLVIYAVGLIGNTTVIYLILKAPKMKMLFALVLSMNIADCLLLQWPFREFMCNLIISIDQYKSSSIYFLTVMSIDCYLVVVDTTKSRKMSYFWPFVTVIILPFTVFAKMYQEQGWFEKDLLRRGEYSDFFLTNHKSNIGLFLTVSHALILCLLLRFVSISLKEDKGSKKNLTQKSRLILAAEVGKGPMKISLAFTCPNTA